MRMGRPQSGIDCDPDGTCDLDAMEVTAGDRPGSGALRSAGAGLRWREDKRVAASALGTTGSASQKHCIH